MSAIPNNPKIFHITHVDNLPGIVGDDFLWSDSKRLESEIDCHVVGMATIKERRLSLPVRCLSATFVGEYVPFNLCARSIMLYILHMANHPELTYRGGQRPMVHLVADLRTTVEWAEAEQRPWAVSDGNAATRYTNFYNDLDDLGRIDWESVENQDFRDPVVKEGKQSEFLLYESFPWHLIEKIGVIDRRIEERVHAASSGVGQLPVVSVERSWYY